MTVWLPGNSIVEVDETQAVKALEALRGRKVSGTDRLAGTRSRDPFHLMLWKRRPIALGAGTGLTGFDGWISGFKPCGDRQELAEAMRRAETIRARGLLAYVHMTNQDATGGGMTISWKGPPRGLLQASPLAPADQDLVAGFMRAFMRQFNGGRAFSVEGTRLIIEGPTGVRGTVSRTLDKWMVAIRHEGEDWPDADRIHPWLVETFGDRCTRLDLTVHGLPDAEFAGWMSELLAWGAVGGLHVCGFLRAPSVRCPEDLLRPDAPPWLPILYWDDGCAEVPGSYVHNVTLAVVRRPDGGLVLRAYSNHQDPAALARSVKRKLKVDARVCDEAEV